MKLNWQHILNIQPRSYVCSYCGNPLSSEKGWFRDNTADSRERHYIYICHHCSKPTYFDEYGSQTPGSNFGNIVNEIDDKDVKNLYEEARRCTGQNAFTASVLSCRKLLMHIAVAKGAEKNLSFIKYVEYLSDNNFIPPGSKEWVDHIRNKGNEANHEIVIMNKEDAEELISFCEMLLKIIYEFPARIKSKEKIN